MRVAPELLRFLIVVWKGRLYVMTLMSFVLNVAPKLMTIVVQWATREFSGVDSYIDDVKAPSACLQAVADRLLDDGLPTKPAEEFITARVLGLQLSKDRDGVAQWSRRDGLDLKLPEPLRRRSLASWCGHVIGHVPVCGWLRPVCSFLKRMAAPHGKWDEPLPPELVRFCEKLQARLCAEGDPAHGEWSVNREAECILSMDASNIAYGAVLEVAGVKVEDRSWLRELGDKRHINVVELDAVIKVLNMAISWEFQCTRLVTDSKTVAAWLHDVLKNVRRVKTSGLYDVLIPRHLQILSDVVITTGISVSIEWVPFQKNAADVLTRVPNVWVKYCKCVRDSASVVSAVSSQPAGIVGPVTLRDIQTVQLTDDKIQAVISQLEHDLPIEELFTNVSSQLVVEYSMLWRSVRLPIEGAVQVPVIAADFVEPILQAAQNNSCHASWSTMYQMIRKKCYFSKIAVACREYVSNCG